MASEKEFVKMLRQTEEELKNDMELLENKFQERFDMLSRYAEDKNGRSILSLPDRIAAGVTSRILSPLKREMNETMEISKKLAEDGLTEEVEIPETPKEHVMKIEDTVIDTEPEAQNARVFEKTPVDRLFELIMKKGTVKVGDAAYFLRVHEIQAEEWGRRLETHGLISLDKTETGRMIMKRKN